MIFNRNTICLLFLSALLMFGCENELPTPDAETAETTFTLNLTSMDATVANTYAMSTVDESGINTLDILLFGEGGSHNFYNLVKVDAEKIVNSGTPNLKAVKVEMPITTGKYQVVMLANLRREIDSVRNVAEFTTSMTKEQVLERITFYNKEWNTGTPPRYLPMWGEAKGVYSFPHPASSSISFDMLRAVARIDVGINYNSTFVAQGLGNLLRIAKVTLGNTYLHAAAVPDPANYSTIRVSAPTLPGAPASVPRANAEYTTAPTIAFEREIYMNEHPNNAASASETFTLFVGGYYDNSPELSWYRVVLDNVSSPGGYLPILRNFRYIINIKEVNGPGYPTIEDAAANQTYLDTEVLVWSENEIGVNINPQYTLDIEKPRLDLYKEAGTVTLNIETDYSGAGDMSGKGFNFKPGLFIDNIQNPGNWLNIADLDANAGDGAMSRTLVFSWGETTVARDASFIIRAGNMRYKFMINQSDVSWLGIVNPNATYLMDGNVHKLVIAPTTARWAAQIAPNSNQGNLITNIETNTSDDSVDGNFAFTTCNNSYSPGFQQSVWAIFSDRDGVYASKAVSLLIVN